MSKTGEAYILSKEKRAFDIASATIIGSVSLPLLGASAIALGIDHRSARVFLRQRRIGKNGIPFHVFKLRTIPGQDISGQNELGGSAHPLASPLGRLIRKIGIDELPQSINVLCGQMHTVGIRPQIPKTLEQRRETDPVLFDEWYAWAQINLGLFGPGQVLAHKAGSYLESSDLVRRVMRIDIESCENASLENDALCILSTPFHILLDATTNLRAQRSVVAV